MKNLTYKISFPTDKGFWGRKCKNCSKYFKIDCRQIKEEMFCPYCGELQLNDDLWTQTQKKEVDKIARQVGKRFIEDEFEKGLIDLSTSGEGFTFVPGRRTEISQLNSHMEKEVDTEIECPLCKTRFQVFGIFGFCPGCKEDTIMIYEVNIQIILNEVESSINPKRALRHAYKDLVNTFEHYCKKVSKLQNSGSVNFQNLSNVKTFFKKQDIDIYEGIEYFEKVTLKRIFEKRHAYEHGLGIITERYVRNIPEDYKLMGQIAELSKDEFLLGVETIKKVIKNIREKYSQ